MHHSVRRFPEIEGLRAWLAWAVVLDHIAYWSGFEGPIGHVLRGLGWPAVTTFIIVSGFVITHLVVERPEPYRFYLLRRFMRIYPLFVVTCTSGYFAYKLQDGLFDHGFDIEYAKYLHTITVNTQQHFWAHLVAHATMLYGAINYNLLPSTDMAFNMFAWTISLEWQFYIVAPLIITAVVKRPSLALLLAALFGISQMMFKWGLFGIYEQPAALIGMGEFFAVGIASRLLYPMLAGKIQNQYVALAMVIVLYALTRQQALAIWGGVYIGLLSTTPSRLFKLALESPVARYFGTRSYSVFLSHFTVIICCEWWWDYWMATTPSFIPLLVMTVPVIIALADVLYRFVELPGIQFGTLLCNRWRKRYELV